MYNKIKNYIKENSMLTYGDGVVTGISGGADSVCLLHVLNRLKEEYNLSLVAVHVNHMIRGEEADGDEAYVEELCDSLGIKLKIYKKDIIKMAEDGGLSVEEAGRNYRYSCFKETAEEYDLNKIAVAHNLDDLAETVIFNMIRGSSIKGLAGIRPVRDNIIRPLLSVSRQEIEEYLEENCLKFRNDSTNFSVDYDRNRIRHIILPEMKKINNRAVEHICRLAGSAADMYTAINESIKKANILTEDNNSKSIEIKELSGFSEQEQREIILSMIGDTAGKRKDITFSHIESVRELIKAKTGSSLNLPYNIKARVSYGRLIIEKSSEKKSFCIKIEKSGNYQIGDSEISAEIVKNSECVNISANCYEEAVNYDKIGKNLCIRTPKENDYIVINTSGGRKKLSRIFIDKKIDREKRDTWPVVAAGDEIIWVVGLRLSEAYKIDKETKDILLLKYRGM